MIRPAMDDEVAVLRSEEQIARRVAELGREIGRSFAGPSLYVLGFSQETIVFLADLVRRIPLDVAIHLLRVRRQPDPPGGVTAEIVYATGETRLADRDVLLVTDVVDTGVTLSYVLGHIREHAPRSLRVCALVDKPHERKLDLPVDWSAFSLGEPEGDRFLVGYGLGFQGRYQGLPFLGTIAKPDRLA